MDQYYSVLVKSFWKS